MGSIFSWNTQVSPEVDVVKIQNPIERDIENNISEKISNNPDYNYTPRTYDIW